MREYMIEDRADRKFADFITRSYTMNAKPMDVALWVGRGKQVEAKIEEIKNRHKEELAPFNKLYAQITNQLLDFLNSTRQQNAKTKNGTAYKHEAVSYRIEDRDEFMRHIIGSEAWDQINWAVNKTAADDVFSRTQQLLPGVTRSVVISVHLLAPPKPKVKKAAEQETTLSAEEWDEIDASIDGGAQQAAE